MVARMLALLLGAALLTACGGGGGGGTPATPGGGNGGGGVGSNLPSVVTASTGAVNGTPDTFYPTSGDSSSGGNGQTVDGIPCSPTMDESHYHIHFFLGIVKNGSLAALPLGTGMNDPGAASNGFVNTASCFYELHTHDSSDVVHIESSSTASLTVSLFTLGDYLDVWGQTLPSGVTIYTNGQQYTGVGSQLVSKSSYTAYTGNPRSIKLYAHEVIWVESGQQVAPGSLPSVQFTF